VDFDAVAVFKVTGNVGWFNGRSMNTGHQFNLIIDKRAIDNLGEPFFGYVAVESLRVLVVLVANGAVAHHNRLIEAVSRLVGQSFGQANPFAGQIESIAGYVLVGVWGAFSGDDNGR
jgi:hypothetical protein